MSRRQQQRKRRQRRFDPLKAAGYDSRPRRHGILWRIFHNKWIVFGGLTVVALSTVFGTYLTLSGFGGGSQRISDVRTFETATPQPSATATPDANASATATPAPTATPVQRRFAAAPPMEIDPEKGYVATIRTEKGDIRVQLLPKEAPQTVNTFVFLAKNHYYDGLTFHRVIPGFVVQGGDAGPDAPGFPIPQENSGLSHDQLTVALARNNATGQLTAQFYITLQPQPNLDGRDTVFGKVIGGQDVLERLTPRNPERNPTASPGDKILSITIDEGPVS